MRYYIEIDKRNKFTGFFEHDQRIYFPEDRPTTAYFAFMDLIGCVEHMTLRTENNGFHGLIAEYSNDMKPGPYNPFWYTAHDDYKEFSARLDKYLVDKEPAHDQLKAEREEFLKRFPTFSGHIA